MGRSGSLYAGLRGDGRHVTRPLLIGVNVETEFRFTLPRLFPAVSGRAVCRFNGCGCHRTDVWRRVRGSDDEFGRCCCGDTAGRQRDPADRMLGDEVSC